MPWGAEGELEGQTSGDSRWVGDHPCMVYNKVLLSHVAI